MRRERSKFYLLAFLSSALAFWGLSACESKDPNACSARDLNHCLSAKSAQAYRHCVDGRWQEGSCAATELCELGRCVEDPSLCKASELRCKDERTVEHCEQGKAPVLSSCEESQQCERGQCMLASCVNGRWDEGEAAIDCGGACEPCQACKVDGDCLHSSFCDSARGYLCSKRCRSNEDCEGLGADQRCREDGRCAPELFETVWEISKARRQIVLPIASTVGKENVELEILWGDEREGAEFAKLKTLPPAHRYNKPGRYHIKIRGKGLLWSELHDARSSKQCGIHMAKQRGEKSLFYVDCLQEIVSFGPMGFGKRAFAGVGRLKVPKLDVPDASLWTEAVELFADAEHFNQDISHWDVRNVRDMTRMFAGAKAFNQNLSAWQLQSSVNLEEIFKGAGLDKAHFCALLASGGPWSLGNLGIFSPQSCEPAAEAH